jgi:predicted helicase
MQDQRDALRNIRTFPQLVKFLRDELSWPIESENFEELTFDYTPEELGIDTASAAKIQEIKRLRPLSTGQPWGIFFVKFEPKRLPVVALRRVLSRVVLKKRASANSADRTAWQADDLLFVSNYGEGAERQISFAHFSQHGAKADLPTLKVLGWDNLDTPLHLDNVADKLTTKLAWPENVKDAKRWRETWRSAFTLRHLEVITTSKDLAERLADLARAIRARIQTVLAIETKNGPVTKLMKAFREALVHDLRVDDFADMYAQTIAYGLLSARVAHPAHDTADAVATHIPVTNPFLKELMEAFLHLGGRNRKERGGDGIDFDELGISEVVELLDAANMEAVVRDFGDRNRDEDPVIHFYELFLKEYDAKKRMQRGVFYTALPVVSYIVRSAHELLQTGFGLEDGLASTVTWGEMAAKHRNLKIPDGTDTADPFVVILDPATGTATFLVEAIDVIYRTLTAKWKKKSLTNAQQRSAWNEYVPKHLLPRLYGFELMMAPYAIAHMKIGLKLYETGYRFGSDERARIYLTNSLEPASDRKDQHEFAEWVPALAHEAKAVNAIKRYQRFTVVVGNPPYSRASANKNDFIDGLIEPYKISVRDEKNIQPLSDDYIKFIAISQFALSNSGVGIFGMITNNTFLSGRIHRGIRGSLLQSNSIVRVLDLHGSGKVDFLGGAGADDENVFDIQQGVSISVLVKGPFKPRVQHAELIGRRQYKYNHLLNGAVPFVDLAPKPPYYLFIQWDADAAEVFGQYPSLTDFFRFQSVSGKPGDDALLVSFTEEEVIPKLHDFRRSVESSKELKLTEAGRNLATLSPNRVFSRKSIIPYAYRPFDTRYTYYDQAIWTRAVDRLKSCVDGSPILLATKIVKDSSFSHVFVTRLFADVIFLSNTSSVNCYSFPQKGPEEAPNLDTGAGHRGNLDTSLFVRLLGRSVLQEHALHYIYAILFSPEYRRRYGKPLQVDFPRIPLTGTLALFQALARYGGELVAMHLLESPKLHKPLATYTGEALPEVEKISYAHDTVWIDKAQTSGFRGVPNDVWTFHVGGYQVCEKWLKDRKGRTLSTDDITHYQKVVVALNETIRLMKEIDEVIENHGGWPGAFVEASRAQQ